MLAVGVVAGVAAAQRTDITIVKQGAVKSAIDLSALETQGGGAQTFKQVLVGDLQRSGWFDTAAARRASIRVSGRCRLEGAALRADVSVLNPGTGRRYLSNAWSEPPSQVRRLAHRVADAIVEAVTGSPGIASTQIAMIGSVGGRKDVYLCDADGEGRRRVTHDGAVCLSLSWAPAGDALLYTSFHRGYPDVYRLDLDPARRTRVSGYPGINAGAALSPDGRRMAVVLSQHGNPDVYVQDVRRGKLTRVTRTPYAAEASPSWSPDGEQLVFVSDRAGRPHLYIKTGVDAGEKRVTFEGRENVAPDWGPGGKIAYSRRQGGRYVICIYDPQTQTHTQLPYTDADYEEPSWAPDGRHLVCVRTSAYRSALYILDALGDPPVRLTATAGDWSSPAWSPRNGR